MSRGWVYVLDNPSMPGKVKIGFTERIPDIRASELDSTGVPTPFDLKFNALVDQAFELEQAVHASMDANRVRQNREWFDLSVDEAIEAIRSSASAMGLSILFEDKHFPDVQQSGNGDVNEPSDTAVVPRNFVAAVLKTDLPQALSILQTILLDPLQYADDMFFIDLCHESFVLEVETSHDKPDQRYAGPESTTMKWPLLRQIEQLTSQRRQGSSQGSQHVTPTNELVKMREEIGCKRAADILANDALYEEKIFNILFKLFRLHVTDPSRPEYFDIEGTLNAITFFWKLFPKRRKALVQLIDECIENVYANDLRVDRVINAGSLAMMLVECHRVDKAIELLLHSMPAIPQYGGLPYAFALPLGAILNTPGTTKLLDTIIQQLLLNPQFIDRLAAHGFSRQHLELRPIESKQGNQFPFRIRQEILMSSAILDQAKEALVKYANNTQWRCLIGAEDNYPLSEDAT